MPSPLGGGGGGPLSSIVLVPVRLSLDAEPSGRTGSRESFSASAASPSRRTWRMRRRIRNLRCLRRPRRPAGSRGLRCVVCSSAPSSAAHGHHTDLSFSSQPSLIHRSDRVRGGSRLRCSYPQQRNFGALTAPRGCTIHLRACPPPASRLPLGCSAPPNVPPRSIEPCRRLPSPPSQSSHQNTIGLPA